MFKLIRRIQYILAVIKPSLLALFTTGGGKKNRAYFNKIFYQYGLNTVNIGKLNIIINKEEELNFEKNQAYIIISNHQNYFDIPILTYAFKGELRFLAKKEMRKIPLWGPAMAHSEFVFIDRKNRSEALKSLERAKEILTSGIKLLIYPEGTRSRTGKLQTFKKGAFHMAKDIDAKIIPVAVVGLKYGEVPYKKDILVNIGKTIDSKDFSDINELKSHAEKVVGDLFNAN